MSTLPTESDLYGRLVEDVHGYAILLLDPAGLVVSWNPGAERLKGYSESEILGQHYSVFYLADEAAAGVPEEQLATAARDGSAEYEGWRVRKDGTQFWASIVTTAITDDDGRLRGFGKVTRDLTKRHAREEETVHRSLHDELTGLPNRVLVVDRLVQAFSRLERGDTSLAVLFIDLNDFKRINDDRGHDCGDTVLREVAQRLLAAVRPNDTVARIGGDEFVAVCEGLTGDPEALAIADRVAKALTQPVRVGAADLSVSASMGVAMTANPGSSVPDILRRADRAMYTAKRVGGTTSRVHLIGDAEGDGVPSPNRATAAS